MAHLYLFYDLHDLYGLLQLYPCTSDELKSHLFLVHFSVCFSSKKRIIKMYKYEETHQFVVSRKRERKKKKRWKNAAISGVKVQSNGRAEMKATG